MKGLGKEARPGAGVGEQRPASPPTPRPCAKATVCPAVERASTPTMVSAKVLLVSSSPFIYLFAVLGLGAVFRLRICGVYT